MQAEDLLRESKLLSDGTYDSVFLRNSEAIFNCILCNVPNLSGEDTLFIHVRGKKHQMRIQPTFIPDAATHRAFKNQCENGFYLQKTLIVAENLRTEPETSSYLQIYISKSSKPLIGIDYVIELVDPAFKEPTYTCILCDKTCDPRNIISQLTSQNHRMKFLAFHFSALMSVLNKIKRFKLCNNFREEILTKIAQLIENKFGKMKPSTYYHREYKENRLQINTKIMQINRPGEKEFPEIQKILEDLKLIKFDSILPSTSKEDQSDEYQKFGEMYVFEKFKNLYFSGVKKIDENYSKYSKKFEKHPKYADEWKIFWKKRYDELIKEKIDPNLYDFKPEWEIFWRKRLKELHEKEIKAKIKEIKEKIELSKDQVSKFLEEIKKTSKFDENNSQFGENSKYYKNSSKSSYRHQLSESDTETNDSDYEKRRRCEVKRRRTKSPAPKYSDDESSSTNIIVVCRLLAAIELEIGAILLPRVLDLLEKALKMERIEANKSEDLLHVTANIDLLMIIKEKLKGAVNAELIKPQRVRSVKMAITKIAKLLHEAKKLTPFESSKTDNKLSKEQQARQVIAKVLTDNLIKQGKEDISKEEIEELVDEFVESQMENEESSCESQSLMKEENFNYDLTDDDLKVLLRNFSDLQETEQNHLMYFIEKLEKTNPEKTKMLQKYIDIGEKEID